MLPPAEIARQIQVTRRQPGASGEILFHLKVIRDNLALAQAIAAEYTQPALVPACPWLATSRPARPQLTAREVPPGWTFQWSSTNGNAARWLLQYLGTDYSWHAVTLSGGDNTQSFGFSPRAVSVCAMDRAGNLSAPTVIGAAEKAPSGKTSSPAAQPMTQPARSFWGNYKGR
jgi:hypothetical protein